LNHGYSRVNTPVLRNPCLFHHYSTRSTPTYYPPQQVNANRSNAYHPTPSLYTPQSSYRVQSPYSVLSPKPYAPQPYPYYPAPSGYPSPSPIPLSSYSVPAFSYAPTVSSKGLVIVLIATLILVALDLVIVRPQKRTYYVN